MPSFVFSATMHCVFSFTVLHLQVNADTCWQYDRAYRAVSNPIDGIISSVNHLKSITGQFGKACGFCLSDTDSFQFKIILILGEKQCSEFIHRQALLITWRRDHIWEGGWVGGRSITL